MTNNFKETYPKNIDENQTKEVQRFLNEMNESDERLDLQLMYKENNLNNETIFTDTTLDFMIQNDSIDGMNLAYLRKEPLDIEKELEIYFSQYSIDEVIPINLKIKYINDIKYIDDFDVFLSKIIKLENVLKSTFISSKIIIYFDNFGRIVQEMFERLNKQQVIDLTRFFLDSRKYKECGLLLLPITENIKENIGQ
ncbi:hypothetical protein [Pseudoalteromonas undina]|uniref:hypothetical protein n=1 Tax=Pseudoalteromonas undina TaxID=43660 RepID=UPI00138E0DB4|nr:hypothetical protein [Pseudoalteromonas undina]